MEADFWGITDPPPVAVTQVVRPEDQCPLVVDCIEQLGFKPSGCRGWEGGVGISYRNEQMDAAMLVAYTCSAQYPPPPEFYQPYSHEIIQRIYQWIREKQLPCLVCPLNVPPDVILPT